MKKLWSILLLLAVTASAYSAIVKLDIDGRANRIKFNPAEAVGGKNVQPSWAKELKFCYLCFEGAVGNEWKDYKFSFTPERSGSVTLSIRANSIPRPAADWVYYDDIKITGATLGNPSFETVKNGNLANWSWGQYGVMVNAKDAPDGKNYISSSHNNPIRQNFEVTAGKKVTIAFKARFDRRTPGQFHPAALKKARAAAAAKPTLKRDLSKKARIRIEIDSRHHRTQIIQASAGKGLIVRPDKNYGVDSRSYFEIIGTQDLTDQWQEFEFSFKLNRPTKTKLLLRSIQVKGDECWVAYDDLRVTGYKVRNTGFEIASSSAFGGWTSNFYNIAFDPKGAAEGKRYALASYDHAMLAYLYPWETVTVKFKAKNGGAAKAGAPYAVIFDKPFHYYRLYNSLAKYLPLSDKGLWGKDIPQTYTHIKPVPKIYPVFATPLTGKPATDSKLLKIPFELAEENGVARTARVRFGMPFPEKKFYKVTEFQVVDPAGKPVEAQYSAIAFWPDKSIKSLLIQFDAPLKANEKSNWTLLCGRSVKQLRSASPLKLIRKGDDFTIETGRLTAKFNISKFNLLSDIKVDGKNVGSFAPEGLKLIDEHGKVLSMSSFRVSRAALEEKGSKRMVLRLDGKFADAKGVRVANYVVRLGFNANSPKVDFTISFYNSYMVREFFDFTSLGFTFVPAEGKAVALSMSGNNGKRIFQHDDLKLQLDSRFVNGAKARLEGGGSVKLASGKTIPFAIKDFWRRYPKAVNIADGNINFELLPKMPDKKFGTHLVWYLQYPFCEGFYRMKWGMGFTEDISIDFSGSSKEAEIAALDVIPVIDRDHLSTTKVYEGIVPKNVKIFEPWDIRMLDSFKGILKKRELQREYGFMNYGDNYGERGRNWNNNEYDTANGLFLLFLRTGQRDIARCAFAAARHQADVDIVHAYPDRAFLGANAQHAIGHTGVSFQAVDPATWTWQYDGAYRGTSGHVWTEGMLNAWLFAGDAVVMDSALLLGQHLVEYTAPTFTALGTHERSAGWSVRAILALYRATGEKKFLDAARHVVNIALSEQRFDKGGAWPHAMPGDHSGGHKDAYGNCPYLMGILSEMLRLYYTFEPRPEVKKSLISVAGWLRRTHYKEEVGWPYGASWDAKPFHPSNTGCNMLILPGLLCGGRLEGNIENYNIGKNVISLSILNGTGGEPKSFAMQVCYIGGAIDEVMKFHKEYKDKIVPFDGNIGGFIRKFSKKVSDFQTRAPERKEFEVILKANNPVLKLQRIRYGSRPQGKKQFTMSVIAPDGKTVKNFTASTASNQKYQVKLPGKKGDRFRVVINDDMAGIWNVTRSSAFDVFSKIFPGYFCGNAGLSTRYLTIPAGVDKLELKFQPIHSGSMALYLLEEDGSTIFNGYANNNGSPRFPWFNLSKEPRADKSVTVKLKKSSSPRNISMVCVSGGNIGMEVKGIPPYCSVVPALYPAK